MKIADVSGRVSPNSSGGTLLAVAAAADVERTVAELKRARAYIAVLEQAKIATLEAAAAELTRARTEIAAIEASLAQRNRELALHVERIATLRASLWWRLRPPFLQMYRPVRRLGVKLRAAWRHPRNSRKRKVYRANRMEEYAVHQLAGIRDDHLNDRRLVAVAALGIDNELRREDAAAQRPVQLFAQQVPPVHLEAHMGGAPPSCGIDSVIPTSSGGIAIIGWLYEFLEDSVQLHMLHAGRRLSLRPFLARLARPDVAEDLTQRYGISVDKNLGFVAVIDAGIGVDTSDVIFELTLPNGSVTRSGVFVGNVVPTVADIPRLIGFAERTGSPSIFDSLGPFIDSVWSNRDRNVDFEEVQYGSPSPNPVVTVIIPLYGKVDLCSHQLLAFCQDPEFASVDLIYVLDDPRLLETMKRDADYWRGLYRIPFRCIYNSKCIGYPAANNAAADFARSDTLLLLDSDVFPTCGGWLGQLRKTLREIDQAGIVAPVLNYPDGSLQCAGMEFRLDRDGFPFFLPRYPERGLSPCFQDAPFQVQAVTGACILIERVLFEQVGGLDDGFILGEFGASDLSLKVQELGYSVWCDPSVELVRLEQQSFAVGGQDLWGRGLMEYNAWRHHMRWSKRIRSMCPPNAR